MRLLGTLTAALLLVVAAALQPVAHRVDAQGESKVRFAAVHVFLDSADQPLGAYQLQLEARAGVSIVGIEGGEHAAFESPPYHDPRAIQNNLVILAAFSTESELPRGNTRVATVHVMVEGEENPEYQVEVEVAARADGARIPVTASWSQE